MRAIDTFYLVAWGGLLALSCGPHLKAEEEGELKPIKPIPLEPLKPIEPVDNRSWAVPEEEAPIEEEKIPNKPKHPKPAIPSSSAPHAEVADDAPFALSPPAVSRPGDVQPPDQPVAQPAPPASQAQPTSPVQQNPPTPRALPKPSTGGWSVAAEEGVMEEDSSPAEEASLPSPAMQEGKPGVPESALWAEAKEKAGKSAESFRKRPEKRVDLYRRVVDAEPANAEARYRLGLALAQVDDLKGCIAQFERALTLDPKNPKYLTKYASALLREGRIPRALDVGIQALQAAPGSVSAQNTLGHIFFAAGDMARAEQQYKAAIQLEPNQPQYIHNLARVHLNAGHDPQAIEALTEVIRLNPKAHRAYNDRGLAHRRLKKPKEAIEDFQMAIRIKPDFALAHHNLAGIFAVEVDPEYTFRFEALEHAQKAVQLTQAQNPDFLMGLAEAWKANRRYEKAYLAARQAVALDPSEENTKRMNAYSEMVKRGFAGPVTNPGNKEDQDLELRIKEGQDKSLESLNKDR